MTSTKPLPNSGKGGNPVNKSGKIRKTVGSSNTGCSGKRCC